MYTVYKSDPIQQQKLQPQPLEQLKKILLTNDINTKHLFIIKFTPQRRGKRMLSAN